MNTISNISVGSENVTSGNIHPLLWGKYEVYSVRICR